MHPINLKVSSLSPQPSIDNAEGNVNPLQQNPIAPEPGSLVMASNDQESFFTPAICAAFISNVVDQDQAWIAMAQDKNLKPSKRIEAAGAISIEFGEIRDAILLEIAADLELDCFDRMHAIIYISSDKRDQAFISIAQDKNVILSVRELIVKEIQNQAARDTICEQLSNEAIKLREEEAALKAINHQIQYFASENNHQGLLSIALNTNLAGDLRYEAALTINDQSLRDQAYLSIAQDKNLDPSKRIKAAKRISKALRAMKDDILLEIAQDPNIDKFRRWSLAEDISDNTKRDNAFAVIAQDKNLGGISQGSIREDAIRHIQDPMLRDLTWIKIFNDRMSSEGVSDTYIINQIQDTDLQALAREALAAGEIVRLFSAKSARKV